ncbi:MAG: DNA mismatch repair endonuclease MutL [Candidatus Sericytochromatia bacterium]|nr:DNA mismatch repair endonuclease MutL [Candidatus Sericytochromatia bacterium]
MPRIHRLPDVLANQIAAGEVVERPANAARELVDNALDAGATRIEVLVADGGRTLQVVDDGCGIAPEDLPMAFERFATSKVRALSDLEALATMGFRGEALAALGAVARVTIRSRPPGLEQAWSLTCAMGDLGALTPAAGAPGTSVQVTDLFAGTPARLKFLRTDSTETGHVVEALTAVAIAHPEVNFRITVQGKVVLDTHGLADMGSILAHILGPGTSDRLLPVHAATPIGELTGLLCPPEMIRGDRSRQWLFVNGRPIRHPALARAVDEAMAGHVPPSRHPIYVLDLRLDPTRVDFNVHPTKREVRLADAGALHGLIRQAVGAAMRQRDAAHSEPQRGTFEMTRTLPAAHPRSLVPGMQGATPVPTVTDSSGWQSSQSMATMPPPLVLEGRAVQERLSWSSPNPDTVRRAPVPDGRTYPWDALRIVGQLHETYMIAIHPDGVLLIDQHNAHERYLYEQLGEAEAVSQALLLPQPLDLSPEWRGLLAEHRQAFTRMGFAFDADDNMTAVPALLPEGQGPAIIARLLEQTRDGGELAHLDPSDRWRVTLACHGATKAGDRLDMPRMERLLQLWRQCDQPFTCPHGRPTSVLVSMDELHRRCLRGMQTR